MSTISNGTSWRQDRIVISNWVDPIVPVEEFLPRYEEMALANFTAILGGFGATTDAKSIAAQITAADSAGIPIIVSAQSGGGNASDLPVSSSEMFWGYQIQDEPSTETFDGLATFTREIAEERPGKLRFINLLPNYATLEQLGEGVESYEDDYVARFVSEVQPDVLCMDHYPFFEWPNATNATNATTGGYRSNLAVLRRVALAHDIPFWNFFNVMPFGGHSDPTLSQIRWQVFTSLAFGAKGVLYFSYWAVPGDTQNGAIIVRDGPSSDNRTKYIRGPHYADATAVNSVVRAWNDHLLAASSSCVWYLPQVSSKTAAVVVPDCAEDPHVVPAIANVSSDFDSQSDDRLLIGQYVLGDKRTAVMLQNQNFELSSWLTVAFAAAEEEGGGGPDNLEAIKEVDRSSGLERAVRDDSPDAPGLQIALPPGDARLFVVVV